MQRPTEEELKSAKVCAEVQAWVPIDSDTKFLGDRAVLHSCIGGVEKVTKDRGGVLRTLTHHGAFYLDAFSAVYVQREPEAPVRVIERFKTYEFARGFVLHTDAMAWFVTVALTHEWDNLDETDQSVQVTGEKAQP